VIQLPTGSYKSSGAAAEVYLDKLERDGAKKTRPLLQVCCLKIEFLSMYGCMQI
jgi:hypothetical protein